MTTLPSCNFVCRGNDTMCDSSWHIGIETIICLLVVFLKSHLISSVYFFSTHSIWLLCLSLWNQSVPQNRFILWTIHGRNLSIKHLIPFIGFQNEKIKSKKFVNCQNVRISLWVSKINKFKYTINFSKRNLKEQMKLYFLPWQFLIDSSEYGTYTGAWEATRLLAGAMFLPWGQNKFKN